MVSLRFVFVVLGVWTTAVADEWQPLPDGEGQTLLKVAEAALDGHWSQCRRGWCRAVVTDRGFEQEFAFWWDGERVGLEVEQVTPGDDVTGGLPEPRVAVYLPNEQWMHMPARRHCTGFSGRESQRLPRELDIHPHRIWLTMLDGQNPKLRHLDRLREARIKGDSLKVFRNDAGLLKFETSKLRLVFDPQRGFSPVRAEFQTNLEAVSRPDLMLPIVEEYDVARDAHGQWYCRQMTRTHWPRGGKGDPWSVQTAQIVEYESQPDAAQLRLSFKALDLPIGTTVRSRVPSRSGRWVVGRESEGEEALTEEKFRDLGRLLRSRGFAQEEAP
jgi:hypothetical protein